MTFKNQFVNFNDLLTKGYVVVKSFLDSETIELLVNDYNRKQDSGNKNYLYYQMSNAARLVVERNALAIANTIKELGILNADLTTPASIYLSPEAKYFDWHQDHEPWYIYQQLHQYLNFNMPIIKPDPKLSGVSVIPFDILETVLPEYVNRFKHNGATRFIASENSTKVYNDNDGTEFTLPINIDSISVSPELMPGDLLLWRGDLIHKTQDALTHRVAASFRITNRDALINKNILLSGCESKKGFIQRNSELFNRALAVFDKFETDELPAYQVLSNLYTN